MRTAIAPSPTADATRLTEPLRTSPIANPLDEYALERIGTDELRFAMTDSANSVDEIVAAHLLQHVAGRARHDRAEQRFIVGPRRTEASSSCERGLTKGTVLEWRVPRS